MLLPHQLSPHRTIYAIPELATALVVTGRRKSGTPSIDMILDGDRVGHARIPVTVVPVRTLEALRCRQRGTTPPTTGQLPAVPTGAPPAPSLVGRRNAANVLLTDVGRRQGFLEAQLALSPANRSILDHDYDHFPAMALAEAARQLTLIALNDGETGKMRPVRMRAAFDRFAELDSPLIARTAADAPVVSATGGTEVRVDIVQSRETVSSITYAYAPVAV